MKWESLISFQNLKLAWRRINTATNLQYKRFFRESYLVYESGVDKNLREFRKVLKAGVWKPKHSTRIYLPKPSGLQRPISLLDIEDQIMLQAIANEVAEKLRHKRYRVELKTVFSNKLGSPSGSIFFMERWQETYRAFQEKCVEVFKKGYLWSAHFDLSAYYDTISHDLLLNIVSPKADNSRTSREIKNCLHVWSADNRKAITGHGIPQGPVASDFLAEAFFLPIDFELAKSPICYLRYVDDIRLFGRTENEVRKAGIQLEQECRHRGLIPQSSKFEIRQLLSPDDAMGALPSISPREGRQSFEPRLLEGESIALLRSAIGGKPKKVKNKSRFRYVMYRAPENKVILDYVLRLLPIHPEHIDAFTAYFANYSKRKRIVKAALDYLKSEVPYSYVRGELWHLIGRIAGVDELNECIPIARKDAQSRSRCVALSWGVMHFLIRCENEGLISIGNRLSAENTISRSLLGPLIHDREFVPGGIAVRMLKGRLMEQLAIAREMQKRKITLTSIGLRQRDLNESCRFALSSLGVIKRRQRFPEKDWIVEIINELYKCEKRCIWRQFLTTEYEHALQILIEAKAYYPGAPSEWLSLQDSFHDIVVRQLFEFIKARGMPGYSKTVGSDGKLVDYGSLIDENKPFNKEYPLIANSLRAVHNRRNKLPGSHPYHKKGGAQNKWLTISERNSLVPHVKKSLDAIALLVEQNK